MINSEEVVIIYSKFKCLEGGERKREREKVYRRFVSFSSDKTLVDSYVNRNLYMLIPQGV
jgi:hypothetical protein